MASSPLNWVNNAAAFGKLVRIIPLTTWGGGAVLLGTASVLQQLQTPFSWTSPLAALLAVLLLQGVAAHALNDVADWQSGTDQTTPGILSGGSKVLKKKLFTARQLLLFFWYSLFLSLALTCYLCYGHHSLYLFLFLLVGLWAAVAYTCNPLRLAYRPLLGEWLAAWPAMVACTAGTSFLLAGSVPVISWWAGIIHATISVAWLMQHHLPDIAADLTARPVKNTTVAYVCAHLGWRYVTLPAGLYFFLVLVFGLAALPWHKGFGLSLLTGLAGMVLALTTDPRSIADTTRKQVAMMLLSSLHFCLLSASFLYY